MTRPSKLLTLLTALVTAVFSLTAAVALPILWRGWYYGQIVSLRLVEQTGYSESVIRGAFDAVMDYLVKDAPFSTGALLWSESGAAHFADCKVLFRLDFIVLAVSGAILLLLLLAALFSTGFRKRFAISPPLLALFITLFFFALFAIWALADFEGLFTAFHSLCFPGKTNWVFDWRTDEIIRLLPEEFWARTAALVGSGAVALEGVLALLLSLLLRLFTPKTVYQQLVKERGRRF